MDVFGDDDFHRASDVLSRVTSIFLSIADNDLHVSQIRFWFTTKATLSIGYTFGFDMRQEAYILSVH